MKDVAAFVFEPSTKRGAGWFAVYTNPDRKFVGWVNLARRLLTIVNGTRGGCAAVSIDLPQLASDVETLARSAEVPTARDS